MKQRTAWILIVTMTLFFILGSGINGLAQENSGAPDAAGSLAADELLTAPSTASGTDLPSAGPFSDYASNGMDIFKAVGAFVFVMALLFLALKGLGRLSRFRGGSGRNSIIELRGIQALDNRKYIAAVEVEGHIIVVGVAADRITPLAHWAADESLDFNPDKAAAEKQAAFSLDEAESGLLDINVADHMEGGRK